jgi:hypothetical protein
MRKDAVKHALPVNCLLVEGNDKHVFWSLLEYYKVPEVFRVEGRGGINSLIDKLDVELDKPGLTRLGIVVDADTDLQSRWNVLRNKLTQYGYKAVPSKPDADGTILVEESLPVVGIWLMPGNTLPGMLEDFLHFLVPTGDSFWAMAEEVMQKVEGHQECRFRSTYRSKAKIYTWLAWQGEPGKPLGQAITARYLDADAPHAQKLIAWLRNLFALDVR